MARLVKILLIVAGAVIGAGVIASLAVYLFFDPNDFRDDISAGVKNATGRELRIEGDLSLRVFPWIAVGVGRTELGNAEGFGEEPFLAFDSARLSVRLLPLLLRRELAVGTATLEGLVVNLAVAGDGRSNWEDLAAAGEAAAEETTPPPEQQDGTDEAAALDVASIRVSDASLSYADARAGSSYRLSGLLLETGRIAAGEEFDLATSFTFLSQPGELGGTLAIRGTVLLAEGFDTVTVDNLNVNGELSGIVEQATGVNFDARRIVADLDASRLAPGEMDLGIFGLGITAEVEPFAYSGPLDIRAALRVGEFSLKALMQTFGTEPPLTADAEALTRVSF
ncbi:MAG: AsmA family protein, partial [Candidatus Binatia bacterium]